MSRPERLSDDAYQAMLEGQGYGCAICGGVPKRQKKDGSLYRLMTDHNHRTGRVRGLLCFQCNHLVLGKFAQPERLRRAADYLERYA